VTSPDAHAAFSGSAVQKLGAQVSTSQLEATPSDTSADGFGVLSRAVTLKVTAATTIAASAAEMDHTVTSPRRMVHPFTSERSR
jgi:hypothetical protein